MNFEKIYVLKHKQNRSKRYFKHKNRAIESMDKAIELMKPHKLLKETDFSITEEIMWL